MEFHGPARSQPTKHCITFVDFLLIFVHCTMGYISLPLAVEVQSLSPERGSNAIELVQLYPSILSVYLIPFVEFLLNFVHCTTGIFLSLGQLGSCRFILGGGSMQ